jgi:hypothetical protein
MTYEAARRYTAEQFDDRGVLNATPFSSFNEWLRSLTENDLQVKGLRTLRHFAAHKGVKPAGRGLVIVAEKSEEVRPGWRRITEATMSPTWLLPQLTPADLDTLHTSELDPRPRGAPKTPRVLGSLTDLPAWNDLVGNPNNNAVLILEHGLQRAQEILLAAERLL